MSNYLAIASVTATLGQIIRTRIQARVTGSDVSTQRPDDPKSNQIDPRVNVFLYQVSQNAALRNNDLPTRRSDGSVAQYPCAALNLHYLLTFYGDEVKLIPQQLLGATISALHARPVIPRQAINDLAANNQNNNDKYNFLMKSDLAQAIEVVRFSPIPINLEELSKLWSVFFQTPYTLSMAYSASVVLIEEEQETPQPALPVQDYNVYALPFNQPYIDKVTAGGDPNQPILSDSTLIIEGQRLRGGITKALVGGTEVEPQQISPTRVTVPLTSIPSGTLGAGLQGIQIIHKISIGTPPTPHRGVESNVGPFVLQPKVTNVQPSGSNGVEVTFDPDVGIHQRTRLFLNEFNPPPTDVRPARAFTFSAPENNGITATGVVSTDTITFTTHNVPSGDYLVRVQVDGAESPLVTDQDDTSPTYKMYTSPRVIL
jgi:hypothetical protein